MLPQQKTLGEKLKTMRKARGLSQDDVMDITGISKKTIYSYENNRATLSLEVLEAFANFYGCSVGYLLGEHDAKKKDVQDVMDYTGLTENAVLSLRFHKSRWEHNDDGLNKAFLDFLNFFIENFNLMQMCSYFSHNSHVAFVKENEQFDKIEKLAHRSNKNIINNAEILEQTQLCSLDDYIAVRNSNVRFEEDSISLSRHFINFLDDYRKLIDSNFYKEQLKIEKSIDEQADAYYTELTDEERAQYEKEHAEALEDAIKELFNK